MVDEEPHRRGLYVTLGVTLLITGLLGATLFPPAKNRLASPQLGSEFRGPNGAPIPLDEPVDPRR